MRCLFTLLLCPILLNAEEKPKPNTLTPKEIEEGWILLFDGETTFGWKVGGEAQVEKGVLLLGGMAPASITTTAIFPPSEIRLEFRSKKNIDCMRVGLPGLIGSGADTSKNWNGINISTKKTVLTATQETIYLVQPEVKLKSVTLASSGRRSTGLEAVQVECPADNVAQIRSVKLRPLETNPLFNSKDLTGWKIFEDPKRNKSKWTVTKEGWLNVKNGPGDLQTEKKYDDFILQLDCISNGNVLNSGLFFRCIVDEYQNGYEMQIHNGFFNNDRAKPSDYGTGAIYRRVKARKVVPNDNEWFGMTLIARGNHLATWVNGYQTVDWTDDRPADNNPRKGSKTGAGHISIQGHDPTTNLSFRNLRIVELKKEEKKK